MKPVISRLLRHLRLLRFDFLTTKTSSLPNPTTVVPESLTVVESGNVKKWACLKCPGGCGEVISLSLNPNQRPRWSVAEDIWSRPTVHPSVHQKNKCGCHFWIKKGQVNWCRGGRPNRPADDADDAMPTRAQG
ncbi:DUF6527 family protein [Roseovarius sp. THAF8]|uniref:DUF6527 family protein n=1 Tax=Roseovarius sp. THAF8 TaxID=2587846 RepID=UPI0012690AA4|nr:DUF6527 family protein [Roseovarius sp. THAF8]